MTWSAVTRRFLAGLIVMVGTAQAQSSAGDAALAERGAYLLRAAGCVTCHTADSGDAPVLAGGRAIGSPVGTF